MKLKKIRLKTIREMALGSHTSEVAKAAQRTGNAAGFHGSKKYGKKERRANREEERNGGEQKTASVPFLLSQGLLVFASLLTYIPGE